MPLVPVCLHGTSTAKEGGGLIRSAAGTRTAGDTYRRSQCRIPITPACVHIALGRRGVHVGSEVSPEKGRLHGRDTSGIKSEPSDSMNVPGVLTSYGGVPVGQSGDGDHGLMGNDAPARARTRRHLVPSM